MNHYRVQVINGFNEPYEVTVPAHRVEVRSNGSIVFYELMAPVPVRYDADADERIVAVYPSTCIVELML